MSTALRGAIGNHNVTLTRDRHLFATGQTVITLDGDLTNIIYQADFGEYLGQIMYTIDLEVMTGGFHVVSMAYVTGGPADGFVRLDGNTRESEIGPGGSGSDPESESGGEDKTGGFFPGLGLLGLPPIIGLALWALLLLFLFGNRR